MALEKSQYIYSPKGGSNMAFWQGEVIIENGVFFDTDQASGTYPIVYTFEDYNGCVNADTLNLEIVDPKLEIIDPDTLICKGDTAKYFTDYNFRLPLYWSLKYPNNAYFVGSKKDVSTKVVPGYTEMKNKGYWIFVEAQDTSCGLLQDSVYTYIAANPQADFTSNIKAGNIPLEINLEDKSSIDYDSIDSYFWSFGDGGISFAKSPIYTYQNEGVYDVYLKVVSDKGCWAEVLKKGYINAESTSIFENEINGISIFPNPTTEKIHVVSQSVIRQISLFQSNGWAFICIKRFREIFRN